MLPSPIKTLHLFTSAITLACIIKYIFSGKIILQYCIAILRHLFHNSIDVDQEYKYKIVSLIAH